MLKPLKILALLLPILCGTQVATAKNTVLVGVKVPAAQRVSIDQIDHSIWDGLLQKYVNQKGQVFYSGLHRNAADKQLLDQYIASLSKASLSKRATREARLAYWINAYNAVTLKGILREYPTTSIRNHTSRFLGYNIWKHLKLQVDGQQFSLDAMEHEVLRKMSEPRIHFAIVCASHSCPRLLNRAYIAKDLNQQLDANSRNFFANAENFQFDARKNQIKVSAILDWFGSDFGSDQSQQLRRIAPYLPNDQAKRLARSGRAKVSFLEYDWKLNETRFPVPKPSVVGSGSGTRGDSNSGSFSRGSQSRRR